MSIWTVFTQLLPQYPLADPIAPTAMRDALSISAAEWRAQLADADAKGDRAKADALGMKLVTAGTLLAAMEPEPVSSAAQHAADTMEAYRPLTAEQMAQQEARDFEEARKVEVQGVFIVNGKIEAVIYRNGASVTFGKGPAGYQEFCENQMETGEECAIARVNKLKELYGDTAQVIDYAQSDKRPTFGDIYDFVLAHPGLQAAFAMDFLFPADDDDKDADSPARRARMEDYGVRAPADVTAMARMR